MSDVMVTLPVLLKLKHTVVHIMDILIHGEMMLGVPILHQIKLPTYGQEYII